MPTQENVANNTGAESRVPDLWIWLGRSQAFGLIRKKCTAAQAQCLKQIRDQGWYKLTGLTWAEFCKQHLGIERSHADHIIRRLEQFGEAYFHVSEIMRIATESYRQIVATGVIHDDCVDIDGEAVPIVSENGPRIRAALTALRRELAEARQRKLRPVFPSIISLSRRLDDLVKDIVVIACHSKDTGELAAARGMVNGTASKMRELLKEYPQLRWPR
jgi:hypothetical protein